MSFFFQVIAMYFSWLMYFVIERCFSKQTLVQIELCHTLNVLQIQYVINLILRKEICVEIEFELEFCTGFQVEYTKVIGRTLKGNKREENVEMKVGVVEILPQNQPLQWLIDKKKKEDCAFKTLFDEKFEKGTLTEY